MKHNHNARKMTRLPGVAPLEMLREDFDALRSRAYLRCSADVEELVLMQSIEGHSHEGHGIFHGKKFPNTTVDDVSRSLRLSPSAVKEERQLLIDEVLEFAERVTAGQDIRFACNAEGEPLIRCGALRLLEIDPIELLKGFYVGGLRDTAEVRDLANKRYGVEMGYGECYMIDQAALHRLGIDGYELARKPHEQDMKRFEEAGLFAKNGDGNVAYMYIRFKAGPGASDDAAVVMAGKLWGVSAAVGCFLADAVDTLEKYVPVYGDQDSKISAVIEPHIDLTVDDAVDLAYLCAIPYEMQGKLPDDSLRHMLQVDRKLDQCPLESHLAYVAGKPYSEMVLDHGECTNLEFYEYVDQKMAGFKKIR